LPLAKKTLIRVIGVIRGFLETNDCCKMVNILYKQEVYDIVGICMDVYNTLGFGFLEVVYKDAMEIEFIENEKEHQREKEFPILYKGRKLKRTFNADFMLFEKIILEVKTTADGIQDDAIAQTINYLKASGIRVGLIINFGKRKLEYKRVVF
jgi:GxxExxY protein